LPYAPEGDIAKRSGRGKVVYESSIAALADVRRRNGGPTLEVAATTRGEKSFAPPERR